MIFSGSYDSADVQFLLEPIDMPPTPVPEREKLIQSGERHYSELLAPEMVPSAEYLELYQEALKRNKSRMAKAIAALRSKVFRECFPKVFFRDPKFFLGRNGFCEHMNLNQRLGKLKKRP